MTADSPGVFAEDSRLNVGPRFEGDAMLMYGWTADPSMKVTGVTPSLRAWIQAHGAARPRAMLDTLSQNNSSVSIGALIDAVLIGPDPESAEDRDDTPGKLVRDGLKKLPELIEQYGTPKDPNRYPKTERIGDVQVVLDLQPRNPPTGERHGATRPRPERAGVRVVRSGAFQMRSRDVRHRVDLIAVFVFNADGELRGYQGQLQDAWPRVEPVVRSGTKMAAASIMGRSMSHNLGSHAVYHVERDAEELLRIGTKDAARSLQRFMSYLSGRMEYLAGLAAGLPVSMTTRPAHAVFEGFFNNEILTERLCRTEYGLQVMDPCGLDSWIEDWTVDGERGSRPLRTSLPGGVVGTHAVYTILENIYRDAAKYLDSDRVPARTQAAEANPRLDSKIEVHPCKKNPDLIEVRVTLLGTGAAFVDRVAKRLRDVAMVDDDGALDRESWGLKERLITAINLRGSSVERELRPRTVPPAAPGEPEEIAADLSRTPLVIPNRPDEPTDTDGRYEPEFLRLHSEDGNPVWTFWVMRPKQILHVTDRDLGFELEDGDDQLTSAAFAQLLRTEEHDSVVHRFVVLHKDAADEFSLKAVDNPMRLRLPATTYVVDDAAPRGPISRGEDTAYPNLYKKDPGLIPVHSAECRSSGGLLRANLRRLMRRHEAAAPPDIVLLGRDDYAPSAIRAPADIAVHNPAMQAEPDNGELGHLRELPGKAAVIRMHCKKCWEALIQRDGSQSLEDPDTDRVASFEWHEAGDALRQIMDPGALESMSDAQQHSLWYSLAASSLSRVLIVDERLHRDAAREVAPAEDARVSQLQRARAMGITILEPKGEPVPAWDGVVAHAKPNRYDYIVVHLGFLERVADEAGPIPGAVSSTDRIRHKVSELDETKAQIVITTARAKSALPFRFVPFSNVKSWVFDGCSKLEVVAELSRLRRSSL